MDENISASENSNRKSEFLAELDALIGAGELATYDELEKLDRRLAETTVSAEIMAEYQEKSAALREKLLAEKEEEAAHLAEAEKINAELSDLLSSGEIEALREKKAGLEEKFHSLGVLPKKVASTFRDLQRKASIAIAQHFETLDLARWESYTLKLDICNEIDKMLEKKESEMPQCATTLQELRKRWKNLGAVPKEKSEEINSRYLESTRALQHRIDSFFTARHQAQKESLAEKTKLCEEIELLANSTDWKDTSEKIKSMQSRWKELPGCGKAESELFKRFHTAADNFFSARKAHYQELEKRFSSASRQREALIEEAKALDIHNFKAAKELREKFRAAPRAGKAEEHYRQLFDAAMDDFFARRKALFGQIDTDYKDLRAQLEKAGQNPLAEREKSMEIIAKLRSEQFKHYAAEIEKDIRKFETLLDKAKNAARLDQISRQKRLLAELIKIYQEFISGKQVEIPQDILENDESPKVKNFHSLLGKAVSGDELAGKKIEKLLADSNLEAENIVSKLEKFAGIGKKDQPVDLAAELQAAILGNSGVGQTDAKPSDKEQKALIAAFDADPLISDKEIIARFQHVRNILKK